MLCVMQAFYVEASELLKWLSIPLIQLDVCVCVAVDMFQATLSLFRFAGIDAGRNESRLKHVFMCKRKKQKEEEEESDSSGSRKKGEERKKNKKSRRVAFHVE